MTPDERDRLRTVEVDLERLREWVAEDNKELQHLRAQANMGKGAWAVLVKIGAILIAVCAAFAWVWDHLPVAKILK